MKNICWLGIVLLVTLAGARAAVQGKPKYGSSAVRLFLDHAYLQKNSSPDFWALMPYYLPQQDGRSCSIASFAMAINALRASRELGADEPLVTQSGLLKRIQDYGPVKRFFLERGKTLSLDEFSDVGNRALELYGIKGYQVEAIHVDQLDSKVEARIREVLVKSEKSPSDIVLANYLQSEYTGDPEGQVGHVAPVGAFDSKRDRVLILDPDREYYEPYWVSFKTFLKGLATLDRDAARNRGILWLRPAK